MAATQLSFALRTTSNVKTVHLIGSWDSYQGQLPLSRGSRPGSWKGTFRFQTHILQPGQRYWFYYMMDGYKVSHDPSKESVVEPTTGRTLNVLDVPRAKSRSKNKSSSHHRNSARHTSQRNSREVPRGRALPEGAIACPMPMRPGMTAALIEQAYNQNKMDQLAWRLAHASLEEEEPDDEEEEEEEEEEGDYYDDEEEVEDGAADDDDGGQYGYGSDDGSDVPSLSSGSSRSSGSSSPSSVSSICSCERYSLTRDGKRIILDCGGSLCGGTGSTDDDSDEQDHNAEEYRYHIRDHKDLGAHRSHLRDSRRISRHHGSSRRHGMVMV